MTPDKAPLKAAPPPRPHVVPPIPMPYEASQGGAPSRWWIWPLVLGAGAIALITIVLLAGGVSALRDKLTGGAATKPAGPPGGRAVPVIAATVRKGDMNLYLTGLGTVIPQNTVTIRTRVDGQLDKVYFTEGQFVKENELLAQIDPRPYQVQLQQAQGQLAKDQAALNNARVELERDKAAADAISKTQLDAQAALVLQDEGAVKIDEGVIANINLQLTYCRITVPPGASGRIGLKMVDQGNMVHASDATGLAVITQLQPISVVFALPQDDIPQVLKAMKGDEALAVTAFDRDLKNKIATGTLAAIDSTVDTGTGTIRLKATFPNEDSALYPNQFVNARLLVDVKKDVIIAPAAAVQHGPDDSTFVYLVKPDDKVEVRNVVTGHTEGERTVIESGLAPGDIVVTEGVDKLQPGVKVAATQPASRPSATQRSKGRS